MSDDRVDHEHSARTPHSSGSDSVNNRSRRSAWSALRWLVFTSTVASACSVTRVQTTPLPDRLQTGQRGEVRLTLRSGEVVSMYDPRVMPDSIVGFDRPAPQANPRRVAVARTDVTAVAATELSAGQTVAAAVVGTLATLTLLIVASCASA